jgi:hypothetical protein
LIDGGYILQPRKIDDSEIMHAPPVVRELWLYLLRKVNWKDNCKYMRGQGFFQLETIQKDLGWFVGYRRMVYSKPQLTKALRRLREGNMIATTKETRGVFVSVCKYEFYQDKKNYEGNDEETTKEQREKCEDAHYIKRKEKEKKEKKEKDTHFCAQAFLLKAGVEKQLASDWLKVRKTKRLADTETALTAILKEIEKTSRPINEILKICCVRSWGGFKDSWPWQEEKNSDSSGKVVMGSNGVQYEF